MCESYAPIYLYDYPSCKLGAAVYDLHNARSVPGKQMRRRRPRGATSRATVVGAALSVVDKVGLEGLTIRAVAAEARVPPMSLYSHFANKEGLLDLMYAEVAYRLYADAEHATWQAAVAGLCNQVRQVLLEHPGWIPLLSRPAMPLAVPLRERVLRLLAAAGMAPEEALATMTNASLMSIGLVMVELAFRDSTGGSRLATRFERLKKVAIEDPSFAEADAVTRAAFMRTRKLDLSQNFASSLATLIMGLEGRLAAATRS
ncbi:MAG TPA: TetR/AcrR family transcriptional regulator C-terminal domain-containing protein [Polyangiaceae bacterium]|nr:TetR/AcrR family transcriptional regulator C-terminal domain-containing protein [Polyangiaceae bacterium]